MKNPVRYLPLLALLAPLACSKPYSPNLPKHITLNPKDGLGCVLASLSRNTQVEPHFRTYEFTFKSKNSVLSKLSMLYRADYGIWTLPEDDKFYTNFDQDHFAGIVYMRDVPAGAYFVDKAKFIGQSVQLEAAKNQSEPFMIAPGACTYIGEIRVTPIVGKGLMNRTTLKSAKIDIVNSWDRDFELFKKIYPELEKNKVHIEVLENASTPRIGISMPSQSAG